MSASTERAEDPASRLAARMAGLGARDRTTLAEHLAAIRRLLRKHTAAALDVPGAEGDRRVSAAVDEMVSGFLGASDERHHAGAAPPRAVPDPHDAPHDGCIQSAYQHTALGIGITTQDGLFVHLNPALREMLGIEDPLLGPRPISDIVHPDNMVDVVQQLVRLAEGDVDIVRTEMRLLTADSRELWAHVTVSRPADGAGRLSGLVIVASEVTDRQPTRPWSAGATVPDQLHRLPNREFMGRWLDRAFGQKAEPEQLTRVGVCAITLDGFRSVADDLGRAAADRLLVGVAGRLQLAAGAHVLARTGADEFTLLVADPVGLGAVAGLADRLLLALVAPFPVDGRHIRLSASIGVAESATAWSQPSELVRAADIARTWAKALGGGHRVVYDHEHDDDESTRFALLSELPGAIERGEFRLVYQPLVRLSDGRVQGLEALVRWQHPDRGLLLPGLFIDLAEQSGSIVALGRWVLATACRQAATWRRVLGEQAPYVSVNVSPVQLAAPGWALEVFRILESTGLPPGRLQLEITEKAVLGDEVAALQSLRAVRSSGVRLALDDFGTGYSSLAWLRRLPVHMLKIDGSFVDGLRKPAADPMDTSIIEALVTMAHALDLQVTAEWVETDLQRERLAALGCDVGQGHRFGDAGPADGVPALWRRSIGH